MMHLVGVAGLVLALVTWPAAASAQNVTNAQIAAGLADPGRWLTYSGNYLAQRHSPLTQVAPENVHQLSVQWAFQTGVLGKFETTPIVIDGMLYVTGPNNTAWAVDARTGRQIWSYRRNLPDRLNLCCGAVNRGFGVLGNRLYLATLDAHLVALDMKTGAVIWDVVIDDYRRGYTATAAPLVVKDKIVVGIAGAEYGIRGFIDAFDAATGKRAWRFWTVPAPGEPGGDTWEGDSWERGGGSTLGDRQLRSGAEPRLLGHRQSRSRSLWKGSRGRQSLHRRRGGARCGHGEAALVLPVHAARCARLGRGAGARAG
jgi:alcohol dehydrogenase (cytochrome c)